MNDVMGDAMTDSKNAISTPANNPVVWLTGASSGIGYSLAILLVKSNYQVVISARSAAKLETLFNLYPNHFLVVPCDVTIPEQLKAAVEKIKHHYSRLDILITNAGTCEYLDVHQWDSGMMRRVMDSNYLGTVYTIEAALPLMKYTAEINEKNSKLSHIHNHNHPLILGMCSLATCLPFPKAEAYGASKAAVKYFLESLRVDLKESLIDVSIIYPGFVETPLTDRNTFNMPDKISAEQAAKHIFKGINKRQSQIYFPLRFSLILRFLSMLPNTLKHKLSSRL